MIDFGTSTVKRVYARTQNLFRANNKNHGFHLQKSQVSISTDILLCPKTRHFTARDIQLLTCLRQQLNDELEFEEPITDQEALCLALRELQLALRSSRYEDEVLRLRFQLWQAKTNQRYS
jgi:hypothetical protein